MNKSLEIDLTQCHYLAEEERKSPLSSLINLKNKMRRQNAKNITLVSSSSEEAPFDENLAVKKAQDGDKTAFRLLVEKYQQRIFYTVLDILKNQEDARDLTQETFVKAYMSLNQFKGEASFYTWIYRIAFNMSIDFKRKYARRGGDHLEIEERHTYDSPQSVDNDPNESLLRKQQGNKITEALNSLSEDHRTVMILREVDGLSYEEIADALSVSRGTVMSRLHYARKHMQSLLKEFAPDYVQIDDKDEK